ncbi:EAL domain-containing protein [Yersinia intermedia]|uniref:EAL domain-containing protein n=1 Tax=Yersinia intermedia TaxID=631 RepID=UPI003A5C0D0D
MPVFFSPAHYWGSLSASAGQFIPADVFIPEAEKSGLICRITQYVLRQVIIDLNALHQSHPELIVAVNISVADLSAPDFAKNLRPTVQPTGCHRVI